MVDYSFSDGFYVNGPIDNNSWTVYLCCGKQFSEDSGCNCRKNLSMKVILKDGFKEVIVSVFISDQPSIRFRISEKIGSKLRELFQRDCTANVKAYSNLVNSLYKCKRYPGDNLETKSMIQGLVIYISWCLLSLSSNDVGQGYFTTFLSQLGNGVKISGLELPRINTRINNKGKKYIDCDNKLIKSLLSYRFMLSLDTVHQTLLSSNLTNGSWIKICLAWNRCIRPFFYDSKVIEEDLFTSTIHAIIMSLSTSINRNCNKTNLLEEKVNKLEESSYEPSESDFPPETPSTKVNKESSIEDSPKRVNRPLRQKIASPIYRKEAYKCGSAPHFGTTSCDCTTYKTDKPEHLYEF